MTFRSLMTFFFAIPATLFAGDFKKGDWAIQQTSDKSVLFTLLPIREITYGEVLIEEVGERTARVRSMRGGVNDVPLSLLGFNKKEMSFSDPQHGVNFSIGEEVYLPQESGGETIYILGYFPSGKILYKSGGRFYTIPFSRIASQLMAPLNARYAIGTAVYNRVGQRSVVNAVFPDGQVIYTAEQFNAAPRRFLGDSDRLALTMPPEAEIKEAHYETSDSIRLSEKSKCRDAVNNVNLGGPGDLEEIFN